MGRIALLFVALSLSAFLSAFLSVAVPAAPPRPLVIVSDTSIAGFRVKPNGKLTGAIAALGTPTSKQRIFSHGEGCLVRWRHLGVRMVFYNLGGQNPCSPRFGYFSDATAVGSRWRTGKGLRIRDPVRRLRTLYPRASYHSRGLYRGWWLVSRRAPFGERGTYPGLLARTRDQRVVTFIVTYPAGGD